MRGKREEGGSCSGGEIVEFAHKRILQSLISREVGTIGIDVVVDRILKSLAIDNLSRGVDRSSPRHPEAPPITCPRLVK